MATITTMNTLTPNPTEEKRSSRRPWPRWDLSLSPESTESPSKKEKPSLLALMTQMSGKLQEIKTLTSSSESLTWMDSKPDKMKSTNSKTQSSQKEPKKPKLKPLPLNRPPKLKKPISTKKAWPPTTSRWSLNTPSALVLRQSRRLERLETIQSTLSWSSLNDLNKISLCDTYKISSNMMKILILLLSILFIAQSGKILAILDNKALLNSHS